jgi:hypothetical protein
MGLAQKLVNLGLGFLIVLFKCSFYTLMKTNYDIAKTDILLEA